TLGLLLRLLSPQIQPDIFCEGALFFFSSRRRHTRFKCDWSSDVCSSDLSTSSEQTFPSAPGLGTTTSTRPRSMPGKRSPSRQIRSEERRVGTEYRFGVSTDPQSQQIGVKKDTDERIQHRGADSIWICLGF